MKHKGMKKQLIQGLLCLSAGIGFTACVDDSYDLSKDIDMTMQLGTEGLQVKLGTTEKILLSKILEIEDEEMIEETTEGLYYLIEDGNTDFSFDVPTIRTRIDIASLIPDTEIFNYKDYISQLPGGILPDNIEIPAGHIIGTNDFIGTSKSFKFKQDEIPAEVKSVKRILPSADTKIFRLRLNIVTNDDNRLAFVLNDIKNFKIDLPDFIRCIHPSNGIIVDGQSLIVTDRFNINSKSIDLGSFELDGIELKGELGMPVTEADDVRSLCIEDDIAFKGQFSIKTSEKFNIQEGDFAKVEFDMTLDGNQYDNMVEFAIDKVEGIYNPIIDPNVDPIDIGKDLPDFLNDDDVVMDVANPTVRFDINMQNIPTNINFYSELRSFKDQQLTSPIVRLPEVGIGTLERNKENTLYFYQGEKPFDPNGQVEDCQTFEISNLASLVKKIPDEIRINLSDGHIQLRQDELQTIELGKNYTATADYTIYVPFQFNNGLKVVYKDSTDSFKDDLEDYAAEGAIVTATIASTIPLKLFATATPVDINGKTIPEITVSSAEISAADNDGVEIEDKIELNLDFTEPTALQRIDKIKFRIEAGAENNGMLTSKQYLIVKDMRLKLKGPVIADFN